MNLPVEEQSISDVSECAERTFTFSICDRRRVHDVISASSDSVDSAGLGCWYAARASAHLGLFRCLCDGVCMRLRCRGQQLGQVVLQPVCV